MGCGKASTPVNLDASDLIAYSATGCILGAPQISLSLDGTGNVKYEHSQLICVEKGAARTVKSWRLDESQTRRLFQMLVDYKPDGVESMSAGDVRN